MRILFITPLFPYPLESGGQIRFFNLLKRIGKKHDLTLFSFIRQEREKEFIPFLLPYCKKIRVFRRRRVWSPLNFFLSLFTPLPFLCATYWSPQFKKALKQELLVGYDLVHLECFYTGTSLPHLSVPLVLVEHNIEYQIYQKFAQKFKIVFLRPFLSLDVWKMKRRERSFWRRANMIVAVSREDKKKIERILGRKCALVLNGVDCLFFAQVKRKPSLPPKILFVGNFKWFPNRDGVLFLIKDIWPAVKRRFPQAQLWIVGRNLPREFRKLRSKEIKFDGEVDDIREAYSSATLLLVPLRVGGGIKFKVLEAMASGLPVVSTKVGVEGIGAKEGREYLQGETKEELVQKTILLLENRELGEKIGRAGQRFVQRHFSWEKIGEDLERIYQEMEDEET